MTAMTPAAPAPTNLRPAAALSHVPPRAKRVGRHLAVLAFYLAAGVVTTWPTATRLVHARVPVSGDNLSYVWDFWWVPRQVVHLHDPWFTTAVAAPAGLRLGFDTLMPLPSLIMAPVTWAFGPFATFNLLTVAVPGLLCYAMYRVARLWLTTQTGAIAAGALFGLASTIVVQDQVHLNIAVGELTLPLALEAAVLLRRHPAWWRAAVVGAVLGAAMLTNQESAILAVMLVAAALLPWLVSRPWGWRPLAARLSLGAAVVISAIVVAAPQLIAMAQQALAGGAGASPRTLAYFDRTLGVPVGTVFSPSPRLTSLKLTGLVQLYRFLPIHYHYAPGDGVPTFGLALSVLAVVGLAVSWRRRNAWLLTLLWLGSAVLAMGMVLELHGRTYVPLASTWYGWRVSDLMPYTWMVRVPGLAGFRESDRIVLLGLVPAALLAGRAVDWLRTHAVLLLVPVLVLAACELGWPGNLGQPTTLPAVDQPIAADHSGSIVVDIPYGLRSGGYAVYGQPTNPESALLNMADGHPRAASYTSWLPVPTITADSQHAFYRYLAAVEDGQRPTAREMAAAAADARQMHVGWALVWPSRHYWIKRVPGYQREPAPSERATAG
ncbi:MAG TPA: hypothetical protein VGH27_32355 [Streptosporangiaceae bacterium]|jgi:hypothetical protein